MASERKTSKAWQVALQLCAAEVCHENHVEEDEKSAVLCNKIPVPSLFGGAGRTTVFGRMLWCAAMLGTGPVIDLYSGIGDSTALLVDGLAHRSSKDRRLVSFERSFERLSFVAARLQGQDAAIHTVDAQTIQQGYWLSFLHKQMDSSQASALLVAGSTAEYLDVVSKGLGEPGLLLLDPDVELPREEFARDWRKLEALKPRAVAIYNTNLPGGAGWVLNRLLALGTYVEAAAGSNDGGQGELDELFQVRAWSFLIRVDSEGPQWPLHNPPSLLVDLQSPGDLPEAQRDESGTVRMVGSEAKEWIQENLKQGWQWQNTTFRAVRGGEVLRIHRTVGEIVPVEVQRPTEDLLTPPTTETNPHRCLAEADPLIEARALRIPCFLNCEGPDFDHRWGEFRRKVLQNAMEGHPAVEELTVEATLMNKGIVESDEILIHGRSRFISRLRHEYTHDGHLEGFCLFGITAAAFLKGRYMLGMEPKELESHGRRFFPHQLGLAEMETAYTMVTDSDSKGGIEFSFLENSGWGVALEDIVSNLERQKSQLGAPFQLYQPKWASLQMRATGLSTRQAGKFHPSWEQLRICGLGDHLTATFDAVLMAENSLRLGLGSLGGEQTLKIHLEFLGRYCPKHAGQGHQCRQRCELLGSCHEDEDTDPVARFLDGVIHPQTLEELPFDLDERRERLREIILGDTRLRSADLLVCSHPTLLCMVLAEASEKPLFVHASSTLLYGLQCLRCAAVSSNLRYFDHSQGSAHSYLQRIRSLLVTKPQMSFLAEGRFLAEQIQYQVGVQVSWVPPLAMYINEGSWYGQGQQGVTQVVVLRSRFFVSLMGELLRSLLREIVALNYQKYPLEVVFLGKDKQFEEQWLSLQQLAGFDAAILWPNDLHQRTFHEVYRMGMPLLMPDADGLYRAQKMSNWGYSSYGARLVTLEEDRKHPFPPWWNSFNATPEIVSYWERFADWQQMPHVQRFSSLPGLVVQTLQLDLRKTSFDMLTFHRQLCKDALDLVSHEILSVMRPTN
ncbi:unnamed protein product [Cladocopium goreaui]|uniref:tRNA wybutosine-synthesizing protein 2/3/4 n=1 Tax=Cladocopium goreaui TaxID=2562237 RepID=A0A9P1CIE6_9DINO|nr:unnamed protein product [Cladocopium goreaui]